MWYEVPAFRWLLVVVVFTLALVLLVGCASFEGVQMDADEAKACKEQGCTVWTENELRQLFIRAYQLGAQGKGGV